MAEPIETYERSDIRAKSVLRFGLWLAISIVLLSSLLWWWMKILERKYPSPSNTSRSMAPSLSPPLPQLTSDLASEMRRLRISENDILSQYAWVDRKAGVVRIPIKQAMELTAKRGLPTPSAEPAIAPPVNPSR